MKSNSSCDVCESLGALALKTADRRVRAGVLVGDEDKDRQAAESAGCRFVRIDRTGAGNGDIGSLNELLGLLF